MGKGGEWTKVLEDSKVKDIDSDEEIVEETSATLRKGLGFVIGKKKMPTVNLDTETIEDIQFPNDFTSLVDDELTKLMGMYTQLIGYTKFEVAKADVERTARMNKYNWKRSKKYVELRSNEYSHDDIKEMIKADVELASLLTKYDVDNAKYKLMDALLFSYNQSYKVLSRELTKRGLYSPNKDE